MQFTWCFTLYSCSRVIKEVTSTLSDVSRTQFFSSSGLIWIETTTTLPLKMRTKSVLEMFDNVDFTWLITQDELYVAGFEDIENCDVGQEKVAGEILKKNVCRLLHEQWKMCRVEWYRKKHDEKGRTYFQFKGKNKNNLSVWYKIPITSQPTNYERSISTLKETWPELKLPSRYLTTGTEEEQGKLQSGWLIQDSI